MEGETASRSKQSLFTLHDVCLRKMISDFVFLSFTQVFSWDVINEVSAATCLSDATTPNERYSLKCHSTDGPRQTVLISFPRF